MELLRSLKSFKAAGKLRKSLQAESDHSVEKVSVTCFLIN